MKPDDQPIMAPAELTEPVGRLELGRSHAPPPGHPALGNAGVWPANATWSCACSAARPWRPSRGRCAWPKTALDDAALWHESRLTWRPPFQADAAEQSAQPLESAPNRRPQTRRRHHHPGRQPDVGNRWRPHLHPRPRLGLAVHRRRALECRVRRLACGQGRQPLRNPRTHPMALQHIFGGLEAGIARGLALRAWTPATFSTRSASGYIRPSFGSYRYLWKSLSQSRRAARRSRPLRR